MENIRPGYRKGVLAFLVVANNLALRFSIIHSVILDNQARAMSDRESGTYPPQDPGVYAASARLASRYSAH